MAFSATPLKKFLKQMIIIEFKFLLGGLSNESTCNSNRKRTNTI